MIFRQFFHAESCTYTYLLAGRTGGEALLIDPVLDCVARYLQLIEELDLKLVKAVDTHVHADHITGLGELRNRTRCITVMGRESPADVVSMRVRDGETIDIEGVNLDVIHPPGHTACSYSYRLPDRVFTGDTLFIRGTGRTDFETGSSRDSYDSIFNKLLKLSDETLVYPGHDYKGDTVSTIGEERAFNPRLQVKSAEEYCDIMDNLNLPDPKMMDVAVPANMVIGMAQSATGDESWSMTVAEANRRMAEPDFVLVDLRESGERERYGVIPGSIHAPYKQLDQLIAPGGALREMAASTARRLVYYCAYGERSALAVQASLEAGLTGVCHLVGGMDAWTAGGGPIDG